MVYPSPSAPAAAGFPGPVSAAMIDELRRYVLVDPYPFVLDLAECQGQWLATVDGQRIFDWSGYYASKWIGHNHPGLYEVDYLEQLSLAANNKLANPDFLTPQCLEYYRLLHQIAPACMRNPQMEIYAVNSGAEAVENMMKYFLNLHDRKHGLPPNRPGPRRFIYFDQAFHGRTVFALNVTELSHEPVITKDFRGLVQGNICVPFPAMDTDAPAEENRRRSEETLRQLKDALHTFPGEIVGIIVEPIQGAGGHRVAEPWFFQQVCRLAHEFDVFLGFDEVQTAGGQTGTVFMVDQLELPHPPQAVATAKKFGNGVLYMLHPMDDIGVLDSTWGGSLVDMVRVCQEWRIVEREHLIEEVPAKTEMLVSGLRELSRQHPGRIANLRGAGLYQGFSLQRPGDKEKLVSLALEEEQLLLLGAAADSIRLRPNLSVGRLDIQLLMEKFDRLLSKLD